MKRRQIVLLGLGCMTGLTGSYICNPLSANANSRYVSLEAYLKAQQWENADILTYSLILDYGFGNDRTLRNLPCKVLREIDALWVKYSNGRFGFSVQKKIWVESGAKLDGKYPGDAIWKKFCDRIGWRGNGRRLYYYEIIGNASLSSPRGMLPAQFVSHLIAGDGMNLFPRVGACGL